MGIKYDAINYEMPWRPNYEMNAAISWMGGAALAVGVSAFTSLPSMPFYTMAIVSLGMAFTQFPTAFKLKKLQDSLNGKPLQFITLEDLKKVIAKHPNEMWLGSGFEWENRHTQRIFEILRRDTSDVKNSLNNKKKHEEDIGQKWIHGIEPNEVQLYQPLKHTQGHTLIVGTTGSGKTRLFDTFISQAILRDEAVFIIDPKGDKEMADNALRACKSMGQPQRFTYFHPAFADKSVRFDMLRNFTRPTEVATRVAALIPSETGSDVFKAFSWQALNNIVQGLLLIDSRPSLTKFRRYIESNASPLVSGAIQAHAIKMFDNYDEMVNPYLEKIKKKTQHELALKMMEFYYNEVQPIHPHSDLEGLLSMYQHDSTHFSKMIANLLPVLNMLTSGVLGELLSPTVENPDDMRPIINCRKAINDKKVVYMGLDSLSDSTVGSAIGSLLLSDLTSVAGDIYNYGGNNKPINIFVDEASEVLNESFIQLLNKGRGSNIRLFVATQTLADFESRLGSKPQALRVLGNINNTITLRIIDNDTQEYITQNLPLTRIKYVMRSQDQGSHADNPLNHSGSQGERLVEEEAPLFQPQILGMLPNLEFIAKISGGKIIKGRLPILVDEK